MASQGAHTNLTKSGAEKELIRFSAKLGEYSSMDLRVLHGMLA